MPAINVSRTDTFETQRQKINQIGSQIFSISAGGSDLSTGLLKLGDGTIPVPSLSFTTDADVGLIKSDINTLGIVSNERLVFDVSDVDVRSYQDFIVEQKSLSSAEIRIDSRGTEYDTQSYADVPLLGGSGVQATADFVVTSYVGSVTQNGVGYVAGEYFNVPLDNGTGNGATVNVLVEDLDGSITDGGSGYADGVYEGVSLTTVSGSGSSATADILTENGVVTAVILRSKGSGYLTDDVLSANDSDLGGGGGSGFEFTVSTDQGIIDEITFVERGSGYVTGDVLTLNAAAAGSSTPTQDLQFTVTNVGEITSFGINNGGAGYIEDDVLTVDNTLLTAPINYSVAAPTVQTVTFEESFGSGTFSVGDTLIVDGGDGTTYTIYEVNTSGGSLVSIVIESPELEGGEILRFDEGDEIEKTVDTVTLSVPRFVIGGNLTPDLTFIPGETYFFNLEDLTNQDHTFAFSSFPGGEWGNGYVQNVSTFLDINSTTITIPDTSNLFVDMFVSVSSGTGQLISDTKIVSIDSATTLTISKLPLATGSATIEFRGFEYTDNVKRAPESLEIKVTSDTPNLYYYCKKDSSDPYHADEGGEPGDEALITIDLANPRTNFGSGFQVTVAAIDSVDAIVSSSKTGKITSLSLETPSATIADLNSTDIESGSLRSPIVNLTTINAIDSEDLNFSASTATFNSDFQISNKFTVARSTGNTVVVGELKTNSLLNVNDFLNIEDNNISTTSGNNLLLTPAALTIAKVDSTTALVIPVGDNSQRPQGDDEQSGAIRFNTTTQQYEGYNGISEAWSSLGGVRDLDGNTTILPELTLGNNDNNLWFVNDGQYSLKVNSSALEFLSAKTIKSINTAAPDYTDWTANTTVAEGDYLKYRNNIYVVSAGGGGVTAGAASPPTDVSGDPFVNGTATLEYFTTAVAALTFQEISEVRIDPLGTTPLSINNKLRLSNNIISSVADDIIIEPSGTQKVVIDTTSSLVIPVGDNNQKGNPDIGSIRYNTDDTTFEGFDGSTWGSLGGVKDIDGDTLIKPESVPNADEDTLYFINAGNNSLTLTTAKLTFDNVDEIDSTSDLLDINVSTVNFDSNSFTIDNTSADTTFLLSTKTNLDFGLSTGLVTDPVLRINNSGDILYNQGFGSGTEDLVTLFSNDLRIFELDQAKIKTAKIFLERGITNNGNSVIYSIATEASAKICLTAFNITTGAKELVEYYVVDDGTDIFFTDYNNVKSSVELISASFDINASNQVRITVTLNDSLTVGDEVEVTLVSTITQR